MPNQLANHFTLIDRAVDGRLAGLLREWREQGWSTRRIAAFLVDEGFPVSRETVRRWLHDLDLIAV